MAHRPGSGPVPNRLKAGPIGPWLGSALRLAEVRLRIPIILVIAALTIGRWDAIRNYWGWLTRGTLSEHTAKLPVSIDTEYFCPMDPGVVSHGPGRCGVCNMALVRRKHGDAVMLPDGVIARMQLSPYRIQLAGALTSPLGYLPLNREWSTSGLVARENEDTATVTVDAPLRLAPWIAEGQTARVDCSDLPGRAPLSGRVRSLVRGLDKGREFGRATVAIDHPPAALRGGMIVGVTFRIPVAELDPFRDQLRSPPPRKSGEPRFIYLCHDHPETIALTSGRCPLDGKQRMGQSLGDLERLRWNCPMHPKVESERPGGVCEQCGGMALRPQVISYAPEGQVLAVPQSAVVDNGDWQAVFVEGMPGMFDEVRVVLGPRCGDHYPVVEGLAPGQNIVISGAFLLDAETRLNPSLAAGYFGAAGTGRVTVKDQPKDSATATDAGAVSASDGPLAGLSPDDRAAAGRQRDCPVTGRKLGSMGAPVRLEVSGRAVFLCCDGCRPKFERAPDRYLSKLSVPVPAPPDHD